MCLFFVFLFQSFFIHVGWGDDAWFIDALNNTGANSTVSFLVSRYKCWSSRTFIEFFLLFFVKYRHLWRIFNAVSNVISAVSISYLIGCINFRNLNSFLCMATLLIPQYIFFNTGWVATTLNYSWPICFGLVSLVLIKKSMNKSQKIHWQEYILLFLSSLFASNQEQVCLMLSLVYVFCFFYYTYKNKRLNKALLLSLFANFTMLIYEATCPGNRARYAEGLMNLLPNFNTLALYRKLDLGFSSTLHEIITKPNLLFPFFSLLIFLCVFSKSKGSINFFISGIPFFTFISFNFLDKIFPRELEGISALKCSLTKYGSGITLKSPRSIILDLLFLAVVFSVVYSLFLCFENKFNFLFSFGILSIGFASRMLMGFSPTIWASGERTFLFLYFSMIMVSVLVYREINSDKVKGNVYMSLGLLDFIVFFSILFAGQY